MHIRLFYHIFLRIQYHVPDYVAAGQLVQVGLRLFLHNGYDVEYSCSDNWWRLTVNVLVVCVEIMFMDFELASNEKKIHYILFMI